jgi:hypothetical protein
MLSFTTDKQPPNMSFKDRIAEYKVPGKVSRNRTYRLAPEVFRKDASHVSQTSGHNVLGGSSIGICEAILYVSPQLKGMFNGGYLTMESCKKIAVLYPEITAARPPDKDCTMYFWSRDQEGTTNRIVC